MQYKCVCGKTFYELHSFNGHKSHCLTHLGKEKYDDRKLQYRKNLQAANDRRHQDRLLREKQQLEDWLQTEPCCEFCNKLMTQKYGNGRFCSASCARSFSSSGNKHFQKSKIVYRPKAFRVYAHICAVCGWCEDKRILEVHHKDSNRSNNDVDNLIILCPICHSKITTGYYKLSFNETENLYYLVKVK